MAIYKILINKLDSSVETLFNAQVATAGAPDVAIGKLFINKYGVLTTGAGHVYNPVYSTNSEWLKPQCYRYRVIPTEQEYDKLDYNNSKPPVGYKQVAPVFNTGEGASIPYAILVGNEYEDFKQNLIEFAVYDNKLKGYVLDSIQLPTSGEAVPMRVLQEIKDRFGLFVLPSEFAGRTTRVNLSANPPLAYDVANILRGNGIWVTRATTPSVHYAWTKLDNTYLGSKALESVSKQVKLLMPDFLYEMQKFDGKGNLLANVSDITGLIAKLTELRTKNHIENTTKMRTANTPEVISGKTLSEVLDDYTSSAFESVNEKEDFYTNIWKTFNDSFERLVTEIAYRCFIPNMG